MYIQIKMIPCWKAFDKRILKKSRESRDGIETLLLRCNQCILIEKWWFLLKIKILRKISWNFGWNFQKLLKRNMTFKKSIKYFKISTQSKSFRHVIECCHYCFYIFRLACYLPLFDRCKNHFCSAFLSKVANFLLVSLHFRGQISKNWNVERIRAFKYFSNDTNFYHTTNYWKVINKNKNTIHLFDIYFRDVLKLKFWNLQLIFIFQKSRMQEKSINSTIVL